MKENKTLRVLFISLGIGLATFILGVCAGYYSVGQDLANYPQLRPSRRETFAAIQRLSQGVVAYQKEHGKLPETLDKIPLPKNGYPHSYKEDCWGQPYVYQKTGKDFVLLSYGKDGKPGGDGWDAAITSLMQRGDKLPPVTFSQYLSTGVYWGNCILVSVILAMLTASLLSSIKEKYVHPLERPEPSERTEQIKVVGGVLAFIIVACMAGGFAGIMTVMGFQSANSGH
jgi:hypothetical protein